jgi:hypothetical protein
MSVQVICAVFCDRVLTESDQVSSLIRLVDRATQAVRFGPDAPPDAFDKAPYALPLTFYVSVWAEHPGAHKMSVSLSYESGERLDIGRYDLEFAEPRQGHNFAIRFEGFPRPGVLWAETAIDGQVRIRTPLTLLRSLDTTPDTTP